ncbi:putative transcription factor interactor and regulator CCHC(Zn) family [Rosa chinensis]|uniref:Putative transcription factor interactor and regulator CCHC(Zn) family n=1 Tax=Rosa chinensis TaxID=74649 RepID=A0A2P6PIV2_ROSCH|nr:putative transcription factor interactor and regulator CCHC(Zn) family [Rosa chinensis]
MLAQYGMYSGMLSSTCFGQPSGMQSNLLSSIGNHGVTQNRMCPYVTSGMTNVHQYNASPATTQYGVFTPQHTMIASTCFAIPPASATSPASFQHNFIPSSGNYQSMPFMGNDGFMMNNNMVNEGSYNPMPFLFDVSHQTSGFIAQNGSNMSLPFSHQQQHASTMNNCNYNSTPHQNAILSQQNFSHQTVQNDSSNNDYQQNGFINSFADGGYSDDSTSYPNFPSNKGTNNYNNRSNKNNGKPRTNGNFINVIVCQICEKPGHSAYKCYYRNCQQQHGASSSSVVCQICDKIGHPASKCHLRNPQPQIFATRHQYDCHPPSPAAPQALSASICTQPKPPSIATQPTNNASQSQVVKSLPFSLSVPTRPQLQQALLTKLAVLRTPRTWLLPSTLDRNLMNCRQACESSNSWRSLPLIPPG